MSKSQRKWIVPIQVTRETTATVVATSSEEAGRLADEGKYWMMELGGEIIAVDVIGTAVPEEE